MRAASLQQPWAWWVVSAPPPVAKRIENRKPTSSAHHMLKHRRHEPFCVHVSAGFGGRLAFQKACDTIRQACQVGGMLLPDHTATPHWEQWLAFKALYVRGVPVDDTLELRPSLDAFVRGGIVARTRTIGLITPDGDPADLETRALLDAGHVDMRWHIRGQFGHVLADVERLPFVQCDGALGLWTVPEHVMAQVTP